MSKISGLLEKRWSVPAAAAAAFVILFTRRPDAILNPQFWAEDGRNWYADAYNHGLFYSLSTPEAGYYQTFSRLVANFAQIFPLSFGPAIFIFFAVAVQVAVVIFILSPRFGRVIPSAKWRVAAAAIYLISPHSAEVFVNVTNSQWHLAFLCFLIILAPKSTGRLWRIFDITVFAVSAVSGPVCILLLPIIAIKYFYCRENELLLPGLLLFAGAAVQLYGLSTHVRPIQADLGADLPTFIRIASRHFFGSPIIGGRGYRLIEKTGSAELWIALVISIVGFAMVAYAFFRSKIELRLFIIFSALIAAAALYSPAVTAAPGQWLFIADHDTALRYWFIPGLGLFAVLAYLSRNAAVNWIKYAATALLALSLIGILLDWKQQGFENMNFQRYAAEFEQMPSGTEFSIPINPNWEMKLTKK